MTIKQEIILYVAASILAFVLYAGVTGKIEAFDDAVMEWVQ